MQTHLVQPVQVEHMQVQTTLPALTVKYLTTVQMEQKKPVLLLEQVTTNQTKNKQHVSTVQAEVM